MQRVSPTALRGLKPSLERLKIGDVINHQVDCSHSSPKRTPNFGIFSGPTDLRTGSVLTTRFPLDQTRPIATRTMSRVNHYFRFLFRHSRFKSWPVALQPVCCE